MTRGLSRVWRRETGLALFLLPCCLAGLVLVACSRDDGGARQTLSPTPTLFVATATTAGISGPPQTPQSTEPPRERSRAEAFLRRIAPTEADLPPGFSRSSPPVFDQGPRLGPSGIEPVLRYETSFQRADGQPAQPDGTELAVKHTGYVFANAADAQAWFAAQAPAVRETAAGATLNRISDPHVEQIGDLALGEEAVIWRASPSGPVPPEQHAVVWAIAVRRGAAVSMLTIDGTGAAVDRLARDLASRLDQRLAAAVTSAGP